MSQLNTIPSNKELETIANQLFQGLSGFANEFSNRSVASNSNFHLPPPAELNLVESVDQNFNLNDPQTSLHDPLRANDSKLPLAQAGDGSYPIGKHHYQETLSNTSAIGNYNQFKVEDISTRYTDSFANQYINSASKYDDLSHLVPHLEQHYFDPLGIDQSTIAIPFVKETYQAFNQFLNVSAGVSSVKRFDLRHSTNQNFDVHAIRKDFPILSERVNGRQLAWLDNAATTQKPQAVIDRLAYFYQHENSNIHRAAHELAARATDAYEHARGIVQKFINASSPNEIIFTRGTTESINLIANSWGAQHLTADDEIIISNLEHHANIVPWQLLRDKIGFTIKVIPVNDKGELLLDEYQKLLSHKTKLVSFTHVSNALGTITPAKQIIELAHQAGAKVLLDGAQSISHIKVDVQQLKPDFFVFSGHKIFGPTGIGVVYGTEELLNKTQPYQGGGNMIQDVTLEKTIFQAAPNRFEAGTGNIADAVGLGAALEYVQQIGIDRIAQYEHELLDYATLLFRQIPKVTLIGTAEEKTSVMSFTIKGYANEEVGKVLNEYGIAVRTGHHCAQPILRRLGFKNSVRPSFAFYNTFEEIDLLAHVVRKLSCARS